MTITPVEQHAGIELATTEPGQNLITWARALSSAHQIASALCTTAFVPKHFAGKPEEAAAALMLGDELGLAPVSALRSIFVISGTPGMYARTMVALVQSRGHEVWTEAETATKVVVAGRRAGSDKIERSEWTLDRARRAGYTQNKKYEQTPEDMLYARAASTVCRRIAADVLSGIPHSVEELELEQPDKGAVKMKRARPAPPEPEVEAARPEPETPAVEQDSAPDPDGITSAQQKKMGALMREAGITQRDLALAFVADVIGREVGSRNELSKAEAGRVIDALEADAARAEEPVDAEIVPDPSDGNDPWAGEQA